MRGRDDEPADAATIEASRRGQEHMARVAARARELEQWRRVWAEELAERERGQR